MSRPEKTKAGFKRRYFSSSSVRTVRGKKICDECGKAKDWVIKLINTRRGTVNHSLYLPGVRNYICLDCKKRIN